MATLIRRLIGEETGQALVLSVAAFVALTAVMALALDLGNAFGDKAKVQRAADSAAIAAAEVLSNDGDEDAAIAAALNWAAENGYASSSSDVDVTVNIPPASGPYAGDEDFVEVIIDHESETHFAKVLDFNLWEIQARAVASGHHVEPFTGLMPWAVLEDAIELDGDPTPLKYDSNNGMNGNFGALRLFGSGSNDYQDNIKYGVDGPVCVESMPDCDDPTEDTESGNMVSGTREGVNYRLANTIDACDAYDEVFTASGEFLPGCNPFVGDPGSLKVLLIPVVEQFCNGHCTVTLKYFSLMYLQGLDKCTGNSCTVTGRFVKNIYDPATELDYTPGENKFGDLYLAE